MYNDEGLERIYYPPSWFPTPPPGNAGVPPAFPSSKELRARRPRSQGVYNDEGLERIYYPRLGFLRPPWERGRPARFFFFKVSCGRDARAPRACTTMRDWSVSITPVLVSYAPPGNAGVPPAFPSSKELRARRPRSQGVYNDEGLERIYYPRLGFLRPPWERRASRPLFLLQKSYGRDA